MKKLLSILFALIFFLSFKTDLVYAEENIPANVCVVTVSTRIYNSANLQDIKMDGDKEVVASHGDIFAVLSLSEEDSNFYEIDYKGEAAYILRAHTLDVSKYSNNIKLDTNATLRVQSDVYVLNGEEFSKTDIVLESGKRIKLIDGLDLSTQYTRVSFELNENTLTYYVLTSNISADGMGAGGITAISLIIACTSLLLILFGFKGRKKKKKQK